MNPRRRQESRRLYTAFTLLEMLAVMTIIAILFAVGAVGLHNTTSSTRINAAARQFAADIHLARQAAIASGGNIRVRFYWFKDSTMPPGGEQWNAYQLFAAQYHGTQLTLHQITDVQLLGTDIRILDDASMSTLLDPKVGGAVQKIAPSSSQTGIPPYSYCEVTVRPDGSLDLPHPANHAWCVTVCDSTVSSTAGSPPLCSRTVVVNPFTCNATVY